MFSRLRFSSSKRYPHQQNQIALNELTQLTNFPFPFTPKMISAQFSATLIIPLYLTFVKYFFALISIIGLFENFSIENWTWLTIMVAFSSYHTEKRHTYKHRLIWILTDSISVELRDKSDGKEREKGETAIWPPMPVCRVPFPGYFRTMSFFTAVRSSARML